MDYLFNEALDMIYHLTEKVKSRNVNNSSRKIRSLTQLKIKIPLLMIVNHSWVFNNRLTDNLII